MFKKVLFVFCLLIFCILSFQCTFAEDNSTNSEILEINEYDGDLILEENPLNNHESRDSSILYSNNVTKYFHGDECFYVSLLNADYSPISNESIKISINGVEYLRQTNNQGISSIALNLNSGNYTVFVCYDGNEYYNSCNATYNVEIKPTIIGFDIIKIFRNNTQWGLSTI